MSEPRFSRFCLGLKIGILSLTVAQNWGRVSPERLTLPLLFNQRNWVLIIYKLCICFSDLMVPPDLWCWRNRLAYVKGRDIFQRIFFVSDNLWAFTLMMCSHFAQESSALPYSLWQCSQKVSYGSSLLVNRRMDKENVVHKNIHMLNSAITCNYCNLG